MARWAAAACRSTAGGGPLGSARQLSSLSAPVSWRRSSHLTRSRPARARPPPRSRLRQTARTPSQLGTVPPLNLISGQAWPRAFCSSRKRSSLPSALRASAHRCLLLFAQALIARPSSLDQCPLEDRRDVE